MSNEVTTRLVEVEIWRPITEYASGQIEVPVEVPDSEAAKWIAEYIDLSALRFWWETTDDGWTQVDGSSVTPVVCLVPSEEQE